MGEVSQKASCWQVYELSRPVIKPQNKTKKVELRVQGLMEVDGGS